MNQQLLQSIFIWICILLLYLLNKVRYRQIQLGRSIFHCLCLRDERYSTAVDSAKSKHERWLYYCK